MKTLKITGALIIALSFIFATSCDKYNQGQVNVAITGDYSDLTPNSVTLFGWCNQKEEEGLSVSYGVEYSDTDLTTAAKTFKAESKNSDNKYSCKLSGLLSGTTYYYRAYVLFNGLRKYGEVKTFTTPKIKASVTAESTNVSSFSAKISGNLTVEAEGSFTKSVVLYYSSTVSKLYALKSSGTKKKLTLTPDGTFSYFIDGLERNKKYYCAAVASVDGVEFSSSVISFTTLKPSCPSGAVDLGLSVCWATCNLGASKPEDYGGYYQWAGTKDVTSISIYLDWSNCPYHTGSEPFSGWTKYITSNESYCWSGTGSPDNKTVLDPEDDVAHVKLGGKWRMPTIEEWGELKNTSNCSWTWTSINGIEGYRVQSKKSGYTDNWIFLPASGYRYYDSLISDGSYGDYRSSSLYTDHSCYAYDLYFLSGDMSTHYFYRYCGLSVRPVSE